MAREWKKRVAKGPAWSPPSRIPRPSRVQNRRISSEGEKSSASISPGTVSSDCLSVASLTIQFHFHYNLSYVILFLPEEAKSPVASGPAAWPPPARGGWRGRGDREIERRGRDRRHRETTVQWPFFPSAPPPPPPVPLRPAPRRAL